MNKFELLLCLAEKGALHEKVKFTTTKLSKELKCSQQTMSNLLIKLEEQGFIQREATLKGLNIQIIKEGKEMLESYNQRLVDIFTQKNYIKGKVITGMGQGKFYIKQKKYENQFEKNLGFKPFHGTLNIKIDLADRKKFLLSKKPMILKGFKSKDRTYGSIECYPVSIKGEQCAIIVPKRTHHEESVIEIIAASNLRKKHNLKDGSEVIIDG